VATTEDLRWSRPTPKPWIPKPKVFRLRVEGIETIHEHEQLQQALQAPLSHETYNGITLGTYLLAVPALSEDLTKAIHTRGSRVAFLPINFCKRCLLHYDSKPSLHKCPKKSEAKKADSDTSAPCGEEQCNTPPTGSFTTPRSDEPAKLSGGASP